MLSIVLDAAFDRLCSQYVWKAVLDGAAADGK
jgi:hypothetical protein